MNYNRYSFAWMKLNLFVLVFLLVIALLQGQAQSTEDYASNNYLLKVINNNYLKVTVLLPDAEKGYYRRKGFCSLGISATDQAIQTSFTQEGSCIRAGLASSKAGKLDWSIRFKKGAVRPVEGSKAKVYATIELDQSGFCEIDFF